MNIALHKFGSNLIFLTFPQISQSYQIQKKNKIAQELSKQIIYCCTVPKLIPDDVRTKGRTFCEMTSFTEVNAEKQMSIDPEFYVWFHEVQRFSIFNVSPNTISLIIMYHLILSTYILLVGPV